MYPTLLFIHMISKPEMQYKNYVAFCLKRKKGLKLSSLEIYGTYPCLQVFATKNVFFQLFYNHYRMMSSQNSGANISTRRVVVTRRRNNKNKHFKI